MSGQYRPDDLIYFANGPRQGDIAIRPALGGEAVCVSPVAGEQPRIGRELLYQPTGEKTSTGMRIYTLVVSGRLADVDAGAVARVAGANVREGAST